MGMDREQLWLEPVGKFIIVRIRGRGSEALLRELHSRLVQIIDDTQQRHILYDALEMDDPTEEMALLQERLDKETKEILGGGPLRKAILVRNTRSAYLARLAFGQFGEGEYRVFYNDLAEAVRWLEE
jgi:hypothetical protein